MPVNRRQFLQISTSGLAATGFGSGLTTNWWGLDPDVVHDPGSDGDKVVATFCEVCFWKCGLLAHVKDGKVTKLEGNPAHPLSNGRLCPRGTGGTGLLYDPDRLKTPLIRRDKGGKQEFEAVSWDEALSYIADKLKRLADEHGPESLAFFKHGFGASWFKHLFHAYDTPNISHPSYAQCRGARSTGWGLTYGTSVGSPEATDIRNARVLTLIGSHLGENMHNTQVQDFAAAVEKGADIIVVDPRYSTAAGKARHWLPIKPGTDIALILAWIHVLLKEGLYDRDYIAKYATGLAELKAHVAQKTPAWAYVQTGIRPELIVETARLMAGARPAALVHPGRRSAWYGNDTQRVRAVGILNALLGTWGREGGFWLSASESVSAYKGYPPYHEPEPKPEEGGETVAEHQAPGPVDTPRGVVYPFAGSLLSHGQRDASIPGTSDYDIKAWFVYGTNLIQSLPQREKTVEALQNLDLCVVVDVMPTEITGYADVVLPECTYLERFDDLHTPSWREPYIALRQPVIEPLYDSKPGWWIARELARHMGLERFFPWKTPEEYLQNRLQQDGLELAELQRSGVIRGERKPIYIEEGLEPSFGTPSGKIELHSPRWPRRGCAPSPTTSPPKNPHRGTSACCSAARPCRASGAPQTTARSANSFPRTWSGSTRGSLMSWASPTARR